MGLLSRIENIQQRSGGLLARAEQLDLLNKADKPQAADFFTFISSLSIGRCGIYAQEGDFFYLEHCAGFDLPSILNSISTKDFWEGLVLGNGKWHGFEGSSLSPVYQLFSKEMREKITEIHILPFSAGGKSYFFLAAGPIDTSSFPESALEEYMAGSLFMFSGQGNIDAALISKNAEKGHEIAPASLFIASAKLSLESAFSKLFTPLKEKLKAAAFEQLYYSIRPLFPSPNCCVPWTNEEFKITLFAKEDIDDKLLEFQLNTSSRSFFCNGRNDNLLVLPAGQSQSPKGTVSFLAEN